MKYTYIATTGKVTGINRQAVGDEDTGNCNKQELIWGMDHEKYRMTSGVFTPITPEEVETIETSRALELKIETTLEIQAGNREKAKKAQDAIIIMHSTIASKEALGLTVAETDLVALQSYVQVLETDINNPSSDPAYHPPLPPGVVAPDVASISITMTRLLGWNSQLGWKMVFTISDPEYVPANIAISVYSAENCTGYLYTPGALQYDVETEEYYAVCPPGQEKGDVDYHFGLLYGAAQLACWTFAAGTQEEVKLIYGEET